MIQSSALRVMRLRAAPLPSEAHRVFEYEYTSALLRGYSKTLHKIRRAIILQLRASLTLKFRTCGFGGGDNMRATPGSEAQFPDDPVLAAGRQLDTYALVTLADAHCVTETSGVRRVCERFPDEGVVRVRNHTLSPA